MSPDPNAPKKVTPQARYEQKKRLESADIGTIPAVRSPGRREACRFDLERYLTTYFPNSTGLKPFGEAHRKAIARLQTATLEGGLFGNIIPRGYAKTTISENTSIWALSYGHRKFIPIFGADETSAIENIASIKSELTKNDLLYEDFPEICHAIAALDGKAQRAGSQTHRPGDFEGATLPEGQFRPLAQSTGIVWKADTIVLPTIIRPDGTMTESSGGRVTTRGLESGARGMKFKRADGVQQRPDLVIVDDPQTDASAQSPAQINKRLNIIRKSIMRLGSHERKLSVIINATIIQPEDLIVLMMDRKRFPAWQFLKIAMMPKMPDAHETLWLGDYATIRNNYDPDTDGDQARAQAAATAFYVEHREAMDAGAIVSWEHCMTEGEVSAIQHAYNIYIDEGADVFASECQNEPIVEDTGETEQLVAGDIIKRLNNVPRSVVPQRDDKLTVFIDVQGEALFWIAAGWKTDTFAGDVIDYGVWPEQPTRYFGLLNLRNTLSMKYPGREQGAMIRAGLTDLVRILSDRTWLNESNNPLAISKGLIDYGWEKSEDEVKAVCKPTRELWIPSKGKGIPATRTAFDQWKKTDGTTFGRSWRISRASGGATVLFETNFWKTFVRDSVLAPVGSVTSLMLYGSDAIGAAHIDPGHHRLLGDHWAGERSQLVTAEGRTILQWDNEARREQHWFDGIVGCAVAASIAGVRTPSQAVERTGKPVSMLAILAARMAAAGQR